MQPSWHSHGHLNCGHHLVCWENLASTQCCWMVIWESMLATDFLTSIWHVNSPFEKAQVHCAGCWPPWFPLHRKPFFLPQAVGVCCHAVTQDGLLPDSSQKLTPCDPESAHPIVWFHPFCLWWLVLVHWAFLNQHSRRFLEPPTQKMTETSCRTTRSNVPVSRVHLLGSWFYSHCPAFKWQRHQCANCDLKTDSEPWLPSWSHSGFPPCSSLCIWGQLVTQQWIMRTERSPNSAKLKHKAGVRDENETAIKEL